MRNCAAVIPVFNPEPGLLTLCGRLADTFGLVIVVDDGSVEQTDAFDRLPSSVRLLRHTANRGKGCAIKTALRWVTEERPDIETVVFADGDGQHPVADILAVAKRSACENAVVFGVRDFGGKDVPFRSWWGNRWTSLEVRLLFGLNLSDTQTGLRAVPRRLFGLLVSLEGERFEYESGLFGVLAELGEAIRQQPISTIYVEQNRASHFRPLADTFLTQKVLIKSAVRYLLSHRLRQLCGV